MLRLIIIIIIIIIIITIIIIKIYLRGSTVEVRLRSTVSDTVSHTPGKVLLVPSRNLELVY